MYTRITVIIAFLCALLAPVPSHALSESQQDAAIAALQNAFAAQQATIARQQATLDVQAATLAVLEKKVGHHQSLLWAFSRKTDMTRTDGRKGTELYITGLNLHVVDGLGADNGAPGYFDPVVNGLGNVIIGYNKPRTDGANVHTGSHNLVVGDRLNYSSAGGVIFGDTNTISGAYATITAGYNNAATSEYTAISGGSLNTASGYQSSIGGGFFNTASGIYASVGGGQFNVSSGYISSVSGGQYNAAIGTSCCVSGGDHNQADGAVATVGGGAYVSSFGYGEFGAGGLYDPSSPGPGVFHSP